MEYLYSRVDQGSTFDEYTPERAAFRRHIALFCKALKDIEWVDSGDCGPGDEREAILSCLAGIPILPADIARAQLESARLLMESERKREWWNHDPR